jgi:hypothetical protein
MEHAHEQTPWQQQMEHKLEFNPFVNPMDWTGALENPQPLEAVEPEPGRIAEDVHLAQTKPDLSRGAAGPRLEPAQRHELIGQAAYFLSKGRGFTPGTEMADWLAAEAEIDRASSSEQSSGAASNHR